MNEKNHIEWMRIFLRFFKIAGLLVGVFSFAKWSKTGLAASPTLYDRKFDEILVGLTLHLGC
jgi:hypothetical protein